MREEETNGEKQRWDRKCASSSGVGRRGKGGVDVEKRETKKKKKKKKNKREKERTRFHEDSGWLTDDLIKRGTNYRPAGC